MVGGPRGGPRSADTLLARLVAASGAVEIPPRDGTLRSVRVAGFVVATAPDLPTRRLRALWKRYVKTSPLRLLLLTDSPERAGAVLVLGPRDADGPLHELDARALLRLLQEAEKLSSRVRAVRLVAGGLARWDRSGIQGIVVSGLLTEHTLELFRARENRWGEATSLTSRLRAGPGPNFRSVLGGLGHTLRQRPQRGYVARRGGKALAVVHPFADPEAFTAITHEGRFPEGMLASDCEAEGVRYGILASRGRFRLFDMRQAGGSGKWLEFEFGALAPDDRPFLALLSPQGLQRGGWMEEASRDASAFGGAARDAGPGRRSEIAAREIASEQGKQHSPGSMGAGSRRKRPVNVNSLRRALKCYAKRVTRWMPCPV